MKSLSIFATETFRVVTFETVTYFYLSQVNLKKKKIKQPHTIMPTVTNMLDCGALLSVVSVIFVSNFLFGTGLQSANVALPERNTFSHKLLRNFNQVKSRAFFKLPPWNLSGSLIF